MRKITGICLITFTVLCIVLSNNTYGQEINVKIGIRDTIKSKILNEKRSVLIHLPDDYNSSRSYPVLYRLDGTQDLLLETVSIANRLTYSDEIAPEMIIVAVENTNRPRDMWPVNTKYYPETEKAGAKDFLGFIEKELIPYVECNYTKTENRILCGQSLSGIFVVYTFLKKPALFDSYLAFSTGFPDCESYFKKLSSESFQKVGQYNGQNIFITDGLRDPLDPDGEIHRQLVDFFTDIEKNIGTRVTYKLLTYENEGHVPFHSLYDGLKYIFERSIKEEF